MRLNNRGMKKILLGSIAIFICILSLISIPEIQKYNYLKSYRFINDMTQLEFCIFGYLNTHKKFPSNFEEFLPPGEKLYPEGHPKEPTKNFYKLSFGFCKKDSMLIIYLYDFDKEDDHLSVNKSIQNLKLSDVFTFKGDIILDTLYERQNIYEPLSPPPLPAGQKNPEN
jgi:hypothetical protein